MRRAVRRRVAPVFGRDEVIERVSAWLRGRQIDNVLSYWEPLVILAARLLIFR